MRQLLLSIVSLYSNHRILSAIFGVVVGALWTSSACAQLRLEWKALCAEMVEQEVARAGVQDRRVLEAMRATPRHEFVPLHQRHFAYYDMALPIGNQQTISPPFIVAYMTEQLNPQPTDKVLEIGTGSGYQAAILSPLVKEVYTIEIVEPLARRAQQTLQRLGYRNVHTRAGDGFAGWPEAAPFDKIIVTCSPEKVPQPLVDQLREGGRMVIPVGERYQQELRLLRKVNGELEAETLAATLFVPMTGAAEDRREIQPNPLNPTLHNGGFEELTDDGKLPRGWHYVSQIRVVTDSEDAPEGENFATFNNSEPGRGCRALQGFAVDGRKIDSLKLEFRARGKEIRPGQRSNEWPYVVISFYDDRRANIGSEAIGPFQGTFPWTSRSAVIPVPVKAREAILRLGLLGAVGEISFDDVNLEKTR